MAPKDKNFPMAGKLGGMGGKYGRKAENLTAKELKKAGGSKAAAGPKVSIQDTRRDYSRGITLGPKGKPLTGSVTLGNGNTAVYRAGKRVMKATAFTPKRDGGGGGGDGGDSRGSKTYKAPSKNLVKKTVSGAGRSSGSSAAAGISGRRMVGKTTAPGPKSGSSAASGIGSYKPSVKKTSAQGGPAVYLGGGRAGTSQRKGYTPDAWDMDKPYSAAQVADKALLVASLIPGIGVAAKGARTAMAARGLAKVGLKGVSGRAADARVASAIKGYKPKPATSSAKPVPKNPAPIRPAGSKPVPNAGPKRTPQTSTPDKPVVKTPAQKAAETRATNKANKAAEAAKQSKKRAGNIAAYRRNSLTPAQRAAATRKANAAKKGGKK